MSKENKYLINWKFKDRLHVELVLPSYKSLHGDLGYYWDIGASLSLGGTSIASLHIGLIIGWLRITFYRKREALGDL